MRKISQKRIFLSILLICIITVLTIDLNEPESLVDRVEEKDRTTNLMKGSVFEVYFESGGTDRYNYVTHRENYCEINTNSSGCPPENFPEKPPLIQNFKFKHIPNSTVYIPKESVCINKTYQSCSGNSFFEPLLEKSLYHLVGEDAFAFL